METFSSSGVCVCVCVSSDTGVSSLPDEQSGQVSSQQQMHKPSRAWPRLFLQKSPGSHVTQLDHQQQNRTSAEQAPMSLQSLGRHVDDHRGQQVRLEPLSMQRRGRGDWGDATNVRQSLSSVREQSDSKSTQKTQVHEQQSDVMSGKKAETETGDVEKKQQTPQEPSQQETMLPAGKQTEAGTAADVEQTKDKPTSEKNNTETSSASDQPVEKAQTGAAADANGGAAMWTDSAVTSQVIMRKAEACVQRCVIEPYSQPV